MTIQYEARVQDVIGGALAVVRNFVDPTDGGGAGLDYILNVGKPSVLLLTVPLGVYSIDQFPIDGRILPFISIHGRGFYNDNSACYFIRKHTITDSWLRCTAYHANSLLDRRVIAYDSGTAYTDRTGVAAGDLMKAFVRENFAGGVNVTDRDSAISGFTDVGVSGWVTVEANKGEGVSTSKQTDRGSLLRILSEISDDTTRQGQYVGYGLIANPLGTFTFVTRANQWGTDRRSTQANSLILGPDKGNVENWRLDYDYSEEATVVIAGSKGQENLRIIGVAADSERYKRSPFGVIERYVDAPSAVASAGTTAEASAALRQFEPKITFSADLIENSNAIRGIHYDLGDLVTVEIPVFGRRLRFDCRLDTIYTSIRKGVSATRVDLSSPL